MKEWVGLAWISFWGGPYFLRLFKFSLKEGGRKALSCEALQ